MLERHWNLQSINQEKVFAIEARIVRPEENYFSDWWWLWKKYRTMRETLQALKDLRLIHKRGIEFRPTHVYYEFVEKP